jgi:hypothetical protein
VIDQSSSVRNLARTLFGLGVATGVLTLHTSRFGQQ